MRGAALLVFGVMLLVACGNGKHDEQIVIRARLIIAATPGSEPIATGKVLEGSTLAGSPFCVGGKILDSHASTDPGMKPYGLIARTITCADGTLKVGLTPKVGPQGPTGNGSWTLVSGTGAFKGLRGGGKEKIAYDPKDESVGRETLTATVTR
jgi:hypothetical protein